MARLIPLFLLILLAGCEPMGPVPGGALSGDVKTTPIDWDQVSDVSVFQLETRPSNPYSVNVWGVGVEGSMYVAAGDGGESRWTAYIADDPNVRLRINDAIYELRAIHVEDEFELHTVRERYKEKYELGDDDAMASEAWVYRLDPRMESMPTL